MAVSRVRFHESLGGPSRETQEPTRRRCDAQPDYALRHLSPEVSRTSSIETTFPSCPSLCSTGFSVPSYRCKDTVMIHSQLDFRSHRHDPPLREQPIPQPQDRIFDYHRHCISNHKSANEIDRNAAVLSRRKMQRASYEPWKPSIRRPMPQIDRIGIFPNVCQAVTNSLGKLGEVGWQNTVDI